MSELFKFLSSLRLTIVLLILLILFSIVGTLIPQGQEPEFYQQHLPLLSRLISFLQFDHLFRSPLFLSLVLLFLLNLLSCSIKQLPARFRRLKRPEETETEEQPALGNQKPISELLESLRESPEELTSKLKRKNYRVKSWQKEGRQVFLAQKGFPGLFGPELVHLGLVIIIAGGLVSALFSQRLTIALLEGQAQEVPEKGFSLRLDKFTTEFYPDGSIKSWNSLVSIIENNHLRWQKTIRVNHPLKYKGLRFFQMSYGQDWDQVMMELEIRSAGLGFRSITLKPGESASLGDNLVVRVINFIPDFQLDRSFQAFSRSAEPRNPAALIEILEAGQSIFSGWIFYYHPDFNSFQKKTKDAPEVRLKRFEAPPFSVIEASTDPGSNLIWVGSFLLILGLLASFYFPYREILLIIQPPRKPLLKAYARKNRDGFLKEIEKLWAPNKAGSSSIRGEHHE